MVYKSSIHKLIKLHSEYKKIKALPLVDSIYEVFYRQHYMSLIYLTTKNKIIIERMIEMLKEAFDKEQIILQILFDS